MNFCKRSSSKVVLESCGRFFLETEPGLSYEFRYVIVGIKGTVSLNSIVPAELKHSSHPMQQQQDKLEFRFSIGLL
jgi:hypothetical protein